MHLDVESSDFDIETIQPGEAVAVEWSADQYHEDRRALTRSWLGLLHKDPRAFEEGWERGMSLPRKKSDELQLGTWIHLAMEDKDAWVRRTCPPRPSKPPGAKRDGTAIESGMYAQWQNALEAHQVILERKGPDHIDISLDDFKLVGDICYSLDQHPVASALLRTEGWSEQTVVWRHPGSSLLVKVRLDHLIYVTDEFSRMVQDQLAQRGTPGPGPPPGWAISDIKTSKDPTRRAFMRSCRDYGYIEQDAIYTDAVRALLPGEPVRFYFVATRNHPRFLTAVYKLAEDHRQRGRRNYTRSLHDVMERRFKNQWNHPCEYGVLELGDNR